MLTFHSHTSHKMQLLDRSVFGPLKNCYNKASDSMMMGNPGKPLTIYDTGLEFQGGMAGFVPKI